MSNSDSGEDFDLKKVQKGDLKGIFQTIFDYQ
jgi:hypothetical protein